MLVIVWEYMVKPEAVSAFEELYRPDGRWVKLFRASAGFVGTSLMRDERDPFRYVIADRWTSDAAYESFKAEHAEAYAALDALGQRLHRAEHLIGRFTFVE